jgi:hypothetical protein
MSNSQINIAVNARDNATAVFAGIKNSASKSIGSMAVTIGNLASDAILTVTGGFKELIMDTINFGGELMDTSAKLGINVEKLQQLQHLAKMNGIEFETLTGNISKMMGNLASGNLDEMLGKMGIKLADLNGLKPD